MIGAAGRTEEMLRPRLSGDRPVAAAPGLAVRWEISPAALRTAGGEPCRSVLEGRAELPVSAWLEWETRDGDSRAALTVHFAGGERRSAVIVSGAAVREWETNEGKRGLEIRHVEVPGSLRLTVRSDGSSIELLYVWTGLLADVLGLRGGVYDAPTLRTV